MGKIQVAILGSGSHIAKGLIFHFLSDKKYQLTLYTRSKNKVIKFLDAFKKQSINDIIILEDYNKFFDLQHDVLINCIGVGTHKQLQGRYSDYFVVAEKHDNLCLEYLQQKNSQALYVAFSSGAIYGNNFDEPMDENSVNQIYPNNVTKTDYYAISKLYSEAKHRSMNQFNIIDLRVFSYFSRFADLTDGYFLSEIIDCVLNRKTFVTNRCSITRDYIHPKDLFSTVAQCIEIHRINDFFDVYSLRPVDKKQILDYFSTQYGLIVKTEQKVECKSATGSKSIYYSEYHKISQIGYQPKYSSMDTVTQEAKYILEQVI